MTLIDLIICGAIAKLVHGVPVKGLCNHRPCKHTIIIINKHDLSYDTGNILLIVFSKPTHELELNAST